MNVNEKLKKASFEAEIKALSSVPDDECIDWTPAKDLKPQSREIKHVRRWCRTAFIAAATVAVISVTAVLPFLRNDAPENFNLSTDVPQSDVMQSFPTCDISEIPHDPVVPAVSGPYFDQDVPQPEYIPDGYSINSFSASTDGSVYIEYSNGADTIVFQSSPSSSLDGTEVESVIDGVTINGNSGFMGNNINGYVNNGIAWNDGEFSYFITNSQGVSFDELMKIANSISDGEGE